MKKRLEEIDLLRAVATFSVIMIHITGIYCSYSKIGYATNQMMRYAVPIFVLLSGLSLYYSDNGKTTQQSYFTFIKKRFSKVLMPYVAWSTLYMFFEYSQTRHTISIFEIATKLSLGTAAYHLYFIIIILQLYLVYPIIKCYFNKNFKIILSLTFLITLYYQSAIYLNAMSINVLPIKEFGLQNYKFIPTWIFYFVLGMYIAKNIEKLERVIRFKIVTTALWLIGFAILMVDSTLTNTFELSIKPSIMLYTLFSFVFLYVICGSILSYAKRLTTFMKWVSSQSFLIYFSHVFVLDKIVEQLRLHKINFIFEKSIGMFILFLTTSLLTFLLAYIVSLIPISPLFGGTYKKRS